MTKQQTKAALKEADVLMAKAGALLKEADRLGDYSGEQAREAKMAIGRCDAANSKRKDLLEKAHELDGKVKNILQALQGAN